MVSLCRWTMLTVLQETLSLSLVVALRTHVGVDARDSLQGPSESTEELIRNVDVLDLAI